MTDQGNLLEEGYFILEEIVRAFLEELWYLRIPAFTAGLSFLFFAGIGPTGDQTRDIYRVFALNPVWCALQIASSFFFVFLLSLSIWYSGRGLSNKRKDELVEKYKAEEETLTKYSKRKHKISLFSLPQDIREYLRSHKPKYLTKG